MPSNRPLRLCNLLESNGKQTRSGIEHYTLESWTPYYGVPSLVNSTSFSPWCSMVWFSPADWKRNCFVSRKGMFGHQSRGQPATTDDQQQHRETMRHGRCVRTPPGLCSRRARQRVECFIPTAVHRGCEEVSIKVGSKSY